MNKLKKIRIITEAGKDSGFGQLSRCISLYEIFTKKKSDVTLIINGDESILQFLKGKKYLNFNWLKNQKKLFNLIKKTDIIVLDSYFVDKHFCNKITKYSKTTLFIDDTNRNVYSKGFVLNAAINAFNLGYPNSRDIKYLLGIEYALLKEKITKSTSIKLNKEVRSVLITIGGSDPRRLTLPLIKMLKNNFPDYMQNVIINNNHPDLEKIKNLKIKYENINLYVDPNVNKLINSMKNSDIAVSAGGQTLLELVKLRIPTIAIKVVENQKAQIEGLSKKNTVIYGGDWKNNELYKKLRSLIIKLSKFSERKIIYSKCMKLIDGKGPERVSKLLIKDANEKSLEIKKAKKEHLQSILNISNQSDVRKSSFNSRQISLKEHKVWFAKKLKQKNHLFFVAKLDDRVVGQIRAEVFENKAVVSISVSKDHRGKKIGYNMVAFLLDYLKKSFPFVKKASAEIKKDNVSSINFFKSLGFIFYKEININGNEAKEYIYNL